MRAGTLASAVALFAFASVIGTVQLLTPEERALFRGFAINKFRGDPSLFDEGVRILARYLAAYGYAGDAQIIARSVVALNQYAHCIRALFGAELA